LHRFFGNIASIPKFVSKDIEGFGHIADFIIALHLETGGQITCPWRYPGVIGRSIGNDTGGHEDEQASDHQNHRRDNGGNKPFLLRESCGDALFVYSLVDIVDMMPVPTIRPIP
jgi:hypothetical protein